MNLVQRFTEAGTDGHTNNGKAKDAGIPTDGARFKRIARGKMNWTDPVDVALMAELMSTVSPADSNLDISLMSSLEKLEIYKHD